MALIKKAPNYKFYYDTIDGIKIIQMNYGACHLDATTFEQATHSHDV